MQLTVDALDQILSHCDPLTLLNMSRTSKSVRQILMSRNASRHMWIAARRSVALPDLAAEDFSEADYDSLIFERNCSVRFSVSPLPPLVALSRSLTGRHAGVW